MQTPPHFAHEHHEQREEQSGRAGDPECGAPSEVLVDETADDVTGGGTDRDRGEEDGEDAATLLEWKMIGEECRRDGPVCRLADAARRTRREERDEAARETGGSRRDAPDGDAEGDERRTALPVA